MRTALTFKQQQVLDFLKEKILTNGYPPSIREMCDAVGLASTSTIHSHLNTLERKGYIRRDPTKNRAIEILDAHFGAVGREMVNVPVVSRALRGAALLAEDNIEDVFPIPMDYVKDAPCFMIRADGDGAAILDGDMVLALQQSEAKRGDMVIAVKNGKTIIQILSRKTVNCDIIGKVIGLYRRY